MLVKTIQDTRSIYQCRVSRGIFIEPRKNTIKLNKFLGGIGVVVSIEGMLGLRVKIGSRGPSSIANEN